MKTRLLVTSAFLLLSLYAFTQSQGYFGFTASKTALASTSAPVKPGTNIIATANHVYYVSNVDYRIWDIVFSSGTWTAASGNLGGASCPQVKSGTSIISNGDDLYFIGALDSKIYQLRWTSGPGWQYTLLVPTQITVGGTKLNLKLHPGGCEIYYVGSNGKICQMYNAGSSWSAGQLSSIQTVNAISTSALVVTDVHAFYVGTDRKVYDIVWTGSSWTGGNWPLASGQSLVKTGAELTNDFNHLYYVDDNSKICDLIWNSVSGWQWSTVDNSSSYTVRSGTNMICYDKNIFYVNGLNNQMWRLWNPTPSTMSNAVISVPASPTVPVVKNPAQFYVWSNDILEEGLTSTTFKSYHIFYPGTDNKMNMLVYDDQHVPFQSFGCYDPCDLDSNNSGWDNADSIGDGPAPGYNCGLYMSGGINAKEWYYGQVPMGPTTYTPTGDNNIAVCNKHFYYVNNGDNRVCDFLRTPVNGTSKPGYIPAWSDEFNNSVLGSNWRIDFAWGNHNPTACYDIYWNAASNVTEGNGSVSLLTQDVSASPYPGSQTVWVGTDGCMGTPSGYLSTTKSYNYTTGMITTASSGQVISEGQYIESRFRVPRGNRFWSGMWFPYQSNEDINLEFDGNGKVLLLTMYDIVWGLPVTNYAVGFRYYDDYYTYAVQWDANYIRYYTNNELTGIIVNRANHCNHPREINYTIELSDADVHAACTPANFGATLDIDYFRTWNPIPHRLSNTDLDPGAEEDYSIYPNPSKDKISIAGSDFSRAEVYNTEGEKVRESNIPVIDVENFAAGVYFVRITDTKGNMHNVKFIKE